MSQTPAQPAPDAPAEPTLGRITWRAFLVGVLFAGFFAVATVRVEWMWKLYTTTQIPVLPYVLLLLSVMALNPALRWAGLALRGRFPKPFNPAELLIIFVMGMVSSGISTIGMASRLVPTIAGLFNKSWNTDQTRWDLYIEPYVNENAFIAAPGTRQGAQALRDVYTELSRANKLYSAARELKACQEALERQKALAAAPSPTTAPATRPTSLPATVPASMPGSMPATASRPASQPASAPASLPAIRNKLAGEVAVAQRNLRDAQRVWDDLGAGEDMQRILDRYPARIEALKKSEEKCKAALDAIEGRTSDKTDVTEQVFETDAQRRNMRAFQKVQEFRRGLPKTMRAIPGFLYDPGDSFTPAEGLASYRARVGRLVKGTAALALLRQAQILLETPTAASAAKAADLVQAAMNKMEPIFQDEALAARKKELDARVDAARADKAAKELELKKNHQLRYEARADQAERLTKQIKELQTALAAVDAKIGTLQQELNVIITPQLKVAERAKAAYDGLAEVRKALTQSGATPKDLQAASADLAARMKAFRSFDASWERFWIGDIEWSIWVVPLLTWSALILTLYLVFMAFNVLIFKQWAHNENIVYPLAELPMVLTGVEDAQTDGRLPSVFRGGLFWVGLLISSGILAWNEYLVKLLPGVGNIPLMFPWKPYVAGSPLEPLGEWNRLDIIFTLIGLTFLIPARISYSLWTFHGLYLVLTLVIVSLGYGVREDSFELDWATTLSYRTALGGGALLVFAGAILHRVRRYLFCAFLPSAVVDLDAPERKELKAASWLFLVGSVVFVFLLNCLLGANIFYSILYYLVLLVITIGMIRAVAEGGFLSFKCYFGPFHLVRNTVGLDKTWSSPGLLAPLFLFHAVLFTSYRVFIAPAMATALRIRDKLRMRRWSFHLCVAAGILVAFALGIATHIIMSYDRGGDAMAQPTYGHFAQQPFGILKTLSVTNPPATAGGRWWMITGAVGMAALLYFRRHVFWLPHPIGLIMLVNPMMTYYAFSIFIGWVCKSLVSKYGNKDVYRNFRNFFIGLIVGELLIKGLLSGAPLDSPWLWEPP